MLPYLLSAVAFWGSVLGGGFYFARRYVRAFEARSGDEAELAALRARVQSLEELLDATRHDVDRLESAHELTTKMLRAPVEPSDRAT
jgi:hypothetical protein